MFGMCEKVPLFRGSLFLFNSQAYLLRKILLLVSARARTNKCLARVLIHEELRKLLVSNVFCQVLIVPGLAAVLGLNLTGIFSCR